MTRGLRVARWLAGPLAACALAGCATSPGEAAADKPAGSDQPPAAAAAAAPAAAASAPLVGSYHLRIDSPDELRKLLTTYLDLARFQAESDDITSAELDRLAAAAPAQARSLLETEGYFSSQVTVARSTHDDDGWPLIDLTVAPGPRTIVTGWRLDIQGALRSSADTGDRDALALLDRLHRTWHMRHGDAFRQTEWNSAKNDALALLRSEGYPTADWVDTSAAVDVSKQEVVLELKLESGPLYRLGELRIEGLSRYDDIAIRNLADFDPGAPYSEKRLLDYQDRIAMIGLFEGASVEALFDPQHPESTPVRVRVRENPMQAATTGIGFSSNVGPRVMVEHWHRRPFGWHVQSHNKIEVGRDLKSWEGELTSDPLKNQYRNLLAGAVSQLEATGEITTSARVRMGRSLETEEIERLIFGEYLQSHLENALGERTAEAISLNYNWVWRKLDSIVLPTRGLATSIQWGSGWAMSNYADSGLFTRLYTRNTLYAPWRSWLSVLRVELAEVFADDSVGLPDPLMFRAGGDDSVRGYGYRTLGPTENGVLVSGRKLFTASAEISHPFVSSRPALGWALFFDMGNVANEWKELDPVRGYGVGLRWRSPVGPFRIDWAYGEQLRKTRLHVSVGIAL
jgi:translocation and assembly module TamA